MAVLDLSPFNTILKRLETVAERLEQGSASASGAPAPTASASSARAPAAAADDCEIAVAMDQFISAKLPPMQEAAKASGIKDLEECTETMAAALGMLRAGLAGTGRAAKPKDADWGKIFAPVMELGQKANKACDNRSDWFQSRKAAAESVNMVALLTQAAPVGHVKGVMETVDFHCVKALQKKHEKEMVWVKAVKDTLKSLVDWCTENCKMGLTWKFNGEDPVQYFAANPLGSAAAPAAAGGKGAGKSGGGMGSLFGAVEGFSTSNLKKVTDDMKTKNRSEEEKVSVVKASDSAAPAQKTAATAVTAKGQKGPKGAPIFELEKGTNWMIENQDGNNNIVLEDVNMKQLVCIINCRNCMVHIKNKVKNINVDGCFKVTVVCGDVLSAVEFVNSDRGQFQTTGKVNAMAIDKCDGLNVYLSKESMGIELSTSKSSDMNVNIPDPDGGDDPDMIELPIPEQFVTKIAGKKLKTDVSSLYSH